MAVGGAHDTEDRGGEQDPPGRTATRLGGQRIEIEGVEEDTGVDAVGASGRCGSCFPTRSAEVRRLRCAGQENGLDLPDSNPRLAET